MAPAFWNELRFATRSLRKRPWFTISALVVLAAGIGANAAVFTAVKATLLEPLPYPDADRLVMLDLTVSFRSRPGPQRARLWSFPEYSVLTATPNRLVESTAAYAVFSFNLAMNNGAVLSHAEVVTHGYHDVLGLSAEIGRTFVADDGATNASPVAMLSHREWANRFGADSSLIGRTIIVNGTPVTVVGVTPAGFRGLSGEASLWFPVGTAEQLLDREIVGNPDAHWFNVIGRLRSGATLEALRSQMAAIASAAASAFPGGNDDAVRSGSARRLRESRVSQRTRTSLLVLTAGAVLVLLVTCASLAAFLLTRAMERKREAAVRLAMGGSRGRVMWSFLSESVVLSLLGCAAALWVALLGVDLLTAAWPSRFLSSGWNLSLTNARSMGIDLKVILYAIGLSLLTGLVFGLLPAFRATRLSTAHELGKAPSSSAVSPRKVDLRGVVVALGIALALSLLTGAGLLVRSLMQLQQVEDGVRADNVFIFDYSLPPWSSWSRNPTPFQDAYLEQLRRLPDVLAATVSCTPPLERHCLFSRVANAGPSDFSDESAPVVGVQYVQDGFFETFGINILRGRTFERSDDATARRAVVLSEQAAMQLYPDTDPLGQSISLATEVFTGGRTGTVIGVVDNVLYDRPEQGITPDVYVSLRQGGIGNTVALKTVGDPVDVLDEARAVLNNLDRDVPISGVRTIAQLRAASVADTRLLARFLTAFGAVTLILAAAGVWGVVTCSVNQQRREFGLRMALGASSSAVIRLVVRQGVLLAGAGVVFGTIAVLILGRALDSLLFDVSPLDPVAVAGAALLLIGVTILAAYIPASRATTIDPMEVLKSD